VSIQTDTQICLPNGVKGNQETK